MVDADELRTRFPDWAETAIGSGVVAGVAAPFVLGSEPALGAMALAFDRPRRLDSRERALISTVSRLGADALTRAQRFEQEQRVAETLQASLMPEQFPQVDGWRFTGVTLAGEAGLSVGGDWYDVALLPHGAILLSVGDVTGRGPVAAGVMGLVRAAVRALALSDPDPASILEHTDDLLRGSTVHQLATAWVGLLDPATGQMRFASAGHVPPLVLGPNGRRFLDDTPGLLLGTGLPGTRRSSRHDIEPDASIVAYTDGLCERRGESLEVGLKRMAVALGDGIGLDAAKVVRRLVGRPTADDIAILVATRLPAFARPDRLTESRQPAGDGRGDLVVGALEVVAPPSIQWWVTGPGDRGRPLARARRASRTGRGCRGRTGTARVIAGRCSTRSVVRLARRVQRIGDQHDAGDVAGAGSPSAPAATIEHIRPPIDRPPTTTRSGADRGQLLAHRGEQLRRPVGGAAALPAVRRSRRAPSPTPGATACSTATSVGWSRPDAGAGEQQQRAGGRRRGHPLVGRVDEDAAGLGELEHGGAGHGVVAAVVGMDGAHLGPELGRDLLARSASPCPAGSRARRAPRPAGSASVDSGVDVGAGEVGDERRADRAPPAHRLVQHRGDEAGGSPGRAARRRRSRRAPGPAPVPVVWKSKLISLAVAEQAVRRQGEAVAVDLEAMAQPRAGRRARRGRPGRSAGGRRGRARRRRRRGGAATTAPSSRPPKPGRRVDRQHEVAEREPPRRGERPGVPDLELGQQHRASYPSVCGAPWDAPSVREHSVSTYSRTRERGPGRRRSCRRRRTRRRRSDRPARRRLDGLRPRVRPTRRTAAGTGRAGTQRPQVVLPVRSSGSWASRSADVKIS